MVFSWHCYDQIPWGGFVITHPRVLYRYSQLPDKQDFEQLFGDVFSILFCDCDELALQAMSQDNFDAIFIEYSCLDKGLRSSLLAQGQTEAPKILLNADVSLDGVIQLLSSQSLNKCFARPYDANRIKSAVYAAQMRIQEPLSSVFAKDGAQPSVLIVDDEVYATKYLKKNLQVLGAPFDIFCAGNAEEALDILEAHKDSVAVIVSDHKMPGMKGGQLLNKIRNIQPNIVRILTSAYGEVDVALNAMNEGSIFEYIKKPWDAQQVLDCINRALHRHQFLQQQSQQSQQAIETDFQQILAARKSAVNAALGESIDALAGQGTLDEFLSCLARIRVSTRYAPAVRASQSEVFEAQLLKALCVAVQPKLDEMARLADSQVNIQHAFIHAWVHRDGAPQDGLETYLRQELEQAYAVLISATGMPPAAWQLDASPETIRIALPQDLKIYSHLLGPIKQVSERFIQQQTALLMLFVIAGLVQGELRLDAGKQSLGLCFTCSLEGQG